MLEPRDPNKFFRFSELLMIFNTKHYEDEELLEMVLKLAKELNLNLRKIVQPSGRINYYLTINQ